MCVCVCLCVCLCVCSRTVSKGTRLSEAKAINTSLSALGNVIAALADPHSPHVPFRDSKLTRLLQDSLGGTASTAMVATIGPAAVNYSETLSTLLFATRCMAVKSSPVLKEEIDYVELCTQLQAKVAIMQRQLEGARRTPNDDGSNPIAGGTCKCVHLYKYQCI